MKSGRSDRQERRRRCGFTLPEALIATTIFLLLLGGVMGANLFGMRMFQMTESHLKTGDSMREAFGRLTDEIRRSSALWVGDVTNGAFLAVGNGQAQSGSAVMIQPTTNLTNYIVYFLSPGDQSFRRFASATATTSVLAESVTNRTIFLAEDFWGNVLTNGQNNRVIHARLEWFQAQPWLPAPELAKLETCVTRRRDQ